MIRVYLKMVKMINFMLRVLYHEKKFWKDVL